MRRAHAMLALLGTLAGAACQQDVTGPIDVRPSESVLVNLTDGVGFVGKGDVQTVLGWNNAKLQSNAKSLSFALSQAGDQAGTQALTQNASQDATQQVICKHYNNAGTITVYRAGAREGLRLGSRAGSQHGTRSGVLASALAYDARKQNQFTGFTLKGFAGSPTFTATSPWAWGGETWSGDWSWTGWSWDGAWTVDPASNNGTNGSTLENCIAGNGNFESIVNTVTDGDVVEGAVDYGAVVPGAFTPTGTGVLTVNGVPLA